MSTESPKTYFFWSGNALPDPPCYDQFTDDDAGNDNIMPMMQISFSKYPYADKIPFNFWVVALDLNFLAFAFEILLMLVLVMVDQLLKWKYFWIFLEIFFNFLEIFWKYFRK